MTVEVREVDPRDGEFTGLQTVPTVPAERGLVARRAGRPEARVSLSVVPAMAGFDGPTGLVGHYEARSEEAGVAVLGAAVRRLHEEGARRVLGPMDGSPWARYRLAHASPEPPFFSEPTNPPDYPAHFLAAGFVEDSAYVSRLAEDLRGHESPLPPGFQERPLDPSRLASDLAALHALSLEAFSGHLYHFALPLEAVMALYQPLLPLLDPRFVRLVQAPDGTEAAYVLAYPDVLAPGGDRLVLKTLAVRPRWRGHGLGSWLVERVHRLADESGFKSVVHALMLVSNPSLGISERTSGVGGRLLRRYSAYRWDPPAGAAP